MWAEKEKRIVKRFRVNQWIKISPLRVIGPDGTMLGVLSREEALKKAEEYSLDLVEISPNASPPVVKIMDFGKFKYEQARAEKKQKQRQKIGEIKEVRFGIKISKHDLENKTKRAQDFLKNKMKVQVLLRFKGREVTHKDLGFKLVEEFIEGLQEVSRKEGGIKQQGMTLSITLAPK